MDIQDKIILSIRPHALSLAGPFLTLFAVIGVISGARLYFQFSFFGYFTQVLAVAILLSLFHFMNNYWIWHKTVLHITERRIIFRNQLGIFSHNTVELLHKDVTEVSFSQSGFDDSISSTGVLNLKTLSGQVISIDRVKDPNNVVNQINELRQSGVCVMQ